MWKYIVLFGRYLKANQEEYEDKKKLFDFLISRCKCILYIFEFSKPFLNSVNDDSVWIRLEYQDMCSQFGYTNGYFLIKHYLFIRNLIKEQMVLTSQQIL